MLYISILARQLLIMVMYIGIGYVLTKKRMISKEGCSAFSTLLLYVILPCVIIGSFLRSAEGNTTKTLMVSFAASAILLFIAMLISKIIFHNPMDIFSASFSNAGFFGIPIVSAIFGMNAVFYSAGFVALLNILQWIWGQNLLTGEHKFNIKDILSNPLVISLFIGLTLYFIPFKVPSVLVSSISTVSGCNAPIAMIILGSYLAQVRLQDIIISRYAWGVSLVRLLLIPLISLIVVSFLPGLSEETKLSLIIIASAPVGINVSIYAQRSGGDYVRGVVLICHSTLLSIVSLPILMIVYDIFYKMI